MRIREDLASGRGPQPGGPCGEIDAHGSLHRSPPVCLERQTILPSLPSVMRGMHRRMLQQVPNAHLMNRAATECEADRSRGVGVGKLRKERPHLRFDRRPSGPQHVNRGIVVRFERIAAPCAIAAIKPAPFRAQYMPKRNRIYRAISFRFRSLRPGSAKRGGTLRSWWTGTTIRGCESLFAISRRTKTKVSELTAGAEWRKVAGHSAIQQI
jgi:hypothetical protein